MVSNNWNTTGLVNNTYNVTINNGIGLGNLFQGTLPQQATDLFRPNSLLSEFVSGFEAGFANGVGYAMGQQFGQAAAQALTGQSCPCAPPAPVDSTHPQGSLSVGKDGVITTPGGYKIEATSQFEWKVTGPDGKSTRVWGDPHVDEADGGKWDFKRDSTFVLGDGTKINVSTKPWGNGGMTVTGGLEVISGNDRVQVTGIDQGKGTVGQVTQDGFAHANSFGNKDVFVMGQETDDWSFQGKEIIGSENGGESFKLGNDLKPLVDTTNKYGGPQGYADQLVKDILNLLGDMLKSVGGAMQGPSILPPVNTPKGNNLWENTGYNQNTHRNALQDTVKAFGDMIRVISDLIKLTSQVRRPGYTSI